MLAKASEQAWSPENRPEKGEWFWKDVQAMRDWVGGDEKDVQAVLVDAIEGESVLSPAPLSFGCIHTVPDINR